MDGMESEVELSEMSVANLEPWAVARRLIALERKRQDALWGEQNHDPFTYLTVLMEEVGEFAKDALEHRFGGRGRETLVNECVQVAAVAQAMLECLVRDEWAWPDGGRSDG